MEVFCSKCLLVEKSNRSRSFPHMAHMNQHLTMVLTLAALGVTWEALKHINP